MTGFRDKAPDSSLVRHMDLARQHSAEALARLGGQLSSRPTINRSEGNNATSITHTRHVSAETSERLRNYLARGLRQIAEGALGPYESGLLLELSAGLAYGWREPDMPSVDGFPETSWYGENSVRYGVALPQDSPLRHAAEVAYGAAYANMVASGFFPNSQTALLSDHASRSLSISREAATAYPHTFGTEITTAELFEPAASHLMGSLAVAAS